jgi:hypothetical protein
MSRRKQSPASPIKAKPATGQSLSFPEAKRLFRAFPAELQRKIARIALDREAHARQFNVVNWVWRQRTFIELVDDAAAGRGLEVGAATVDASIYEGRRYGVYLMPARDFQ